LGLTSLPERQQNVLSSVIRRYVATAKPVGSEGIAREMDLSSATIRHILMELEEQGFLTHPHTSAGRIPVTQGYRFYVDKLMTARNLNLREKQQVQEQYEEARDEVEVLMKQTAKILSAVTNLAGLATFHIPGEASLSHFRLVEIDPRKVLVILVLEQGLVREEVVRLEEPLQLKEITKILHLLNNRFSGFTLENIRESLLKEAEKVKKTRLGLLEKVLKLIDQALAFRPEEIHLEGVSHLAEQPEFKEADKMEQLVKILEGREHLAQVLKRQWAQPGLRVEIGAESSDQILREFSFVHVPCYYQEKVVGALGVLGPTRMAYDRVTGLAQHLALHLEGSFQRQGGAFHG